VRLIWSKASLRDLEEIAVHIEQDSPRVAELVEERIHQNALLLARFPKSGRSGRVSGTRE
jgi:plasmid stabilization system protein ParE